MKLNLQIVLLAALLLFFAIVFILLKRKRLNLKYSLLWILSCVVMITVVLVPDIIFALSSRIGIIEPVNFVFLIQGGFLLLISLSLSVIVSGLSNNIKRLTQSQALLERRVRELEEKGKQGGDE